MPVIKWDTNLDIYLVKVKTALSLPKVVKERIATLIPYAVIIELVFWIGIILLTSDFIFTIWSESNVPNYLYYGPVGQFMFVYELIGSAAHCGLFTSYNSCRVDFYSSPVITIPQEYTNSTLRLINQAEKGERAEYLEEIANYRDTVSLYQLANYRGARQAGGEL